MSGEPNSIANYIEEMKRDPLEFKRQTGRTHRMMEAAINFAKTGIPTTVLFKDMHSVETWKAKFGEVEGLELIPMRMHMPEFDRRTMTFRDERAKHKVFIDHDVVYTEHKAILKLWSQFDLPITGQPYGETHSDE
jgi:hypothetical protein